MQNIQDFISGFDFTTLSEADLNSVNTIISVAMNQVMAILIKSSFVNATPDQKTAILTQISTAMTATPATPTDPVLAQ